MKVRCSPRETRQAHNWKRSSEAGPIAADMQHRAVRRRHEDAREALVRIDPAISHWSSSLRRHDAERPPRCNRRAARRMHPLMLRPDRRLRPLGACRFNANRRRWTMIESGPGSECLFCSRPTMDPLDSRPAATTLQTASSRRSTATCEKCHLRPRHHSAA